VPFQQAQKTAAAACELIAPRCSGFGLNQLEWVRSAHTSTNYIRAGRSIKDGPGVSSPFKTFGEVP
jgi:hypothetical protein